MCVWFYYVDRFDGQVIHLVPLLQLSDFCSHLVISFEGVI